MTKKGVESAAILAARARIADLDAAFDDAREIIDKGYEAFRKAEDDYEDALDALSELLEELDGDEV
jgi:hypothetical protein